MEHINPEWLQSVISAEVKKSFDTFLNIHPIKCPVPKEVAEELGHLCGVLEDMGDGNVRRGIEVMREHHIIISKLNETRNRIAKVISTTILATMAAAAMSMIWMGVMKAIKGH